MPTGRGDYWLALQALHMGLVSRDELVDLLARASQASPPATVESLLRRLGRIDEPAWRELLAARARAGEGPAAGVSLSPGSVTDVDPGFVAGHAETRPRPRPATAVAGAVAQAAGPPPPPAASAAATRAAPAAPPAAAPPAAAPAAAPAAVPAPAATEDGSSTVTPGRDDSEPSADPSPIRRAHPVVAETPLPQGKPFGKYVVLRELGKGGMGTVYKAHQPDLNRVVALKILAEGETSQEGIRRFYREAQAAARLIHPNIVSVFDVGNVDGKYFIAMEYLDGLTLRQFTRDHKVPVRAVLGILRDVARAIHYAHQNGIIHRDIKPHNILVQTETADSGATPSAGPARSSAVRHVLAKVADFGLAKEVNSRSHLTLSGQILGSPSYMSPEQARGDPNEIDARSDTYALGATLYDAVTGQAPFSGENAYKILVQVFNDNPVPPRKLAPNLHRDVETIILKALEKERDRRYATAEAFAEDLDRFLSGEPILARPPGWLGRIARQTRKHKSLVATIVCALLLVAGVGTYFLAATGKLQELASRHQQALREAEKEKLRNSQVYQDEVQAREQAEAQEVAEALVELAAAEAGRQAAEARAADGEARVAAKQQELSDALKAAAAKSKDRSARLAALAAYHRGLLTANAERALAEFATAGRADPLAVEVWVARAQRYLELGKPEQAAKELDVAISAGGDDAPYAYYLRARARRAQGDENGGLADLREVVKRAPESDLALLVAAEIWHARKEYDKEALVLKNVLRLHPDSTEALRLLGAALLAKGDVAEAQEVLSRLVDREPRSGEAFALRAQALQRAGSEEAARQDLDQALAVDPTCAAALRLRASLAVAQGQTGAALADLDLLVKVAPTDAPALLDRARLLGQVGRMDECLAALQPLLGEDSREGEAFLLRGEVQLARGEAKGAALSFDTALQFLRAGELALAAGFRRGLAAHYQGEIGEAIEHYSRTLAVAPKHVPSLLFRALAYTRQGEMTKAGDDLARAALADRTWGWSYVQGGFAGLDAGVRTALLKDLLVLARANARHPWPVWMRGVILHRKGDLSDARAEYQRAGEICGQAAMLVADTAQLAFDRGQYKEAKETLERFQKLAPRSFFTGWANELAAESARRLEEAKRREK